MEAIRGTFPGGPSRQADALSRARALRLERLEEIEGRLARRDHARARRRRRNRVALGVLTAVVVSGALGLSVGLQSRVTAEELNAQAAEAARAQSTQGQDLERALSELWLMEDLEYQRNRLGR